jgi:hypothetical protein
MWVQDTPDDDDEDIRQTYNFAPGYNGIVYRADVPDYGAGGRQQAQNSGETQAPEEAQEPSSGDADDTGNAEEDNTGVEGNETQAADAEGHNRPTQPSTKENESQATKETRYKLQKMKWGLIPFWTKRKPDYGGLMRTINCRDDSLMESRSMWTTMKQRKRCIVVAQGFYEWEKRNGGRDKIPHFVKRKDGQLMCFAGLWDCVQYEGMLIEIPGFRVTHLSTWCWILQCKTPRNLPSCMAKLGPWPNILQHLWLTMSKEKQRSSTLTPSLPRLPTSN